MVAGALRVVVVHGAPPEFLRGIAANSKASAVTSVTAKRTLTSHVLHIHRGPSPHESSPASGGAAQPLILRVQITLSLRSPLERALAAGDGEGDPVFRPVEGRRKLSPILDADAARGSSAGIDEAPGFREPQGGGFACADDVRQGLAHRGHRRELAFEHRLDGLETRPGVEILEAGTVLFGAHRLDLSRRKVARDGGGSRGVSPGRLTENGAGAMTAARTKPANPGGLRAFGQLSRSARLLGKRARPRIDFSDLRIRGRTLRRQRRTDRRRELQFFIGMSVAQNFDPCLNARS